MKPEISQVVVIGSGLTALGVIRALGRAGISVQSLAPQPSFEQHSRFLTSPTLPWLGSLGASLQQIKPDAVLIPCSDSLMLDTCSLPPEVLRRFRVSTPPLDAVQICTDKDLFRAALERTSVRHPQSVPFRSAEDAAFVPPADQSRWFIKPRNSQAFFARFGIKGIWLSNLTTSIIADALNEGFQLILQEYIPGPPQNHFYIEGLRDRNGILRGLCARQRLRMYPSDFGNSTAMKSIALSEVADSVPALTRLLESMSYRGIFSAEFKRGEVDGVSRLIELNPRPWWYIEFPALCGVNLPLLAVHDACEADPHDEPTFLLGAKMIHGESDYVVQRARVRHNQTSTGEVLREWCSSWMSVARADDPVPGCRLLAGRAFGKLMKIFS